MTEASGPHMLHDRPELSRRAIEEMLLRTGDPPGTHFLLRGSVHSWQRGQIFVWMIFVWMIDDEALNDAVCDYLERRKLVFDSVAQVEEYARLNGWPIHGNGSREGMGHS